MLNLDFETSLKLFGNVYDEKPLLAVFLLLDVCRAKVTFEDKDYFEGKLKMIIGFTDTGTTFETKTFKHDNFFIKLHIISKLDAAVHKTQCVRMFKQF